MVTTDGAIVIMSTIGSLNIYVGRCGKGEKLHIIQTATFMSIIITCDILHLEGRKTFESTWLVDETVNLILIIDYVRNV